MKMKLQKHAVLEKKKQNKTNEMNLIFHIDVFFFSILFLSFFCFVLFCFVFTKQTKNDLTNGSQQQNEILFESN